MKLDWKTCFRAGVSLFALYLCTLYWSGAVGLLAALLGAAAPLLLGCAVAYLVNILMSLYERHYFPRSVRPAVQKSRRPVCMAAAFLTLLAVVGLVVGLVVPELVRCIQVLFAQLPDAIGMLVAGLESMNVLPEDIAAALSAVDWQSKLGQIFQVLTSGLGNVMDVVVNTVSSVFSSVVTLLISLIFAVYLLSGRERLARQAGRVLRRYVKPHWYQTLRHVLAILDDCFHRYIVGQCTEAVILGTLCALGMALLRLPYATMVGALIAFTALIPVAGAYIGAAVGALMILTVSPLQAAVFLVYLVVLQQLENNLIYPRVVGSSMGLPAIWVLAAVTVGGGMLGIPGMLLGVPLASAAYRLLREDVARGEQRGSEGCQ